MTIKKNLLQQSNPGIVLQMAKDLILIYVNQFRRGIYPSFTNYRDITESIAKNAKTMLNKHIKTFQNCIQQFENSNDETIKYGYNSVMDAAKYYKLFKKGK